MKLRTLSGEVRFLVARRGDRGDEKEKNSKRKGEEKYILRMISNISLVKLKEQPKIEFFLFGSSEFSFNSSKSVNA